MGDAEEDEDLDPEEGKKYFLVDYCKRSTTKCRRCKKTIQKGDLRIGKSAKLKAKNIYHYFHVNCAFISFEKAKSALNTITCMDDINGFELIKDEERIMILKLMDEVNAKRAAAESKKPKKPPKKIVNMGVSSKARVSRLKSTNLPTLEVLYTNADQLTSDKMTELKKLVERKKPMVIAVCEVKPKNSSERTVKDYEIPNFTLHPVNLYDPKGRGIAVYTHQSLDKSTIQIKSVHGFEEACLLEIRLRGGDVLLFGCLYRSPTTTDTSDTNNDSLISLLKSVSLKKYSHVCIVGDFNYNSIDWTLWKAKQGENSKEAKFIEGVRDSFLYQHVESPTRRRGSDDPSLLDLIFTNEEMQVSEITHGAPLGKSDHDVLSFRFHCYVEFSKRAERHVFERGDYEAMRNCDSIKAWREDFLKSVETMERSPEDLWCSLKSQLHQMTKKFVPLETPSKEPSWKDKGSVPIDENARRAIKEKEKSHRKWMSAKRETINEDTIRKQYAKNRNKVKTLLRKAKRRFERDIAMKAKTEPKAFWGHARRQLKTKSGVAPLLSDPKDCNSMKFDDVDKANLLLKQFSSVFTREPDGEIPRIQKRTDIKIPNLIIEVKMVLDALKNIKVNKSCGPDNLHPRLLLELADIIALPVTILFNATLKDGSLPKDWKMAYITGVFKKGSKHLPENYRPISLTSILCKIMERFVRNKVIDHLMENGLLSKKQFGFVSGRSTLTQLLYYLDDCLEKIANGNVVDAIYLDFSKAFDTVPHRRLLGKLESYGVQGEILEWINSFLKDRVQQVVVNGSKSGIAPVISGIPQGTVLGPVLFVVYINDLLDELSSDGLMFADDTKVYRQIKSCEDAIILQKDLQKLENWSNTWLLKFNADKCHVLTLGKFEDIKHAHQYVLCNNELEHVSAEKDLGVTIDEDLRFEEHITRKIQVANGIVGQIRRSFSFLNAETFRRLYVAFVRPHLEYCQAVWSPHLLRNIDALENVQIRATKLVDGLAHLDYPERLRRINLPTLVHRRRRGDMIEMFKHFNSYDKTTLSSTFNPRNRPSRQHKLQVHQPRSNDGANGKQTNSFYHRVVPMWNNLPKDVAEAETIDAFKKALDKHWEDEGTKFDHLQERRQNKDE